MASHDRYDTMSDEELIQELRDGDSDVTDYLCNKYKNLVRHKAASMYILGAELEDLIQEGMIGLFKAVRDYDPGRDASFLTFATLCVSRQMYNAIQSAGRQKNIPLNNYISLNGNSDENGDERPAAALELFADGGLSPEQLFIDKENADDLYRRICDELSEFESQVLDLHMTGMNYVQIAGVLGREEKSTDNALQRIRAKIKKIVDK